MSSDNGMSWYSIIPQIEVSNITYSPYNEGLIVASMYSTEDSLAQIAYSVNHGADWTVITPAQLQYVQSYCMDYDFDGNIIKAYLATTDLGIVSYVVTDVPLSINEPEGNNSGVSLYPNPVSTTLTAVSDGSMVTRLEVFNTTGQLIKTTPSAELDMTALSSGLYLVEITANNGKKWVKRIVKK